MPLEPEKPYEYTETNVTENAPKIEYYITWPRSYRWHIILLNAAYTKRLAYSNQQLYRRNLYEIYLWERENINKSLQDYRRSVIENIQRQRGFIEGAILTNPRPKADI